MIGSLVGRNLIQFLFLTVEVNEADDNELLPDKSLSCPKCDITYYSAMSIKNHIQVCKKSKVHNVPLTNLPRVTIKGMPKSKELFDQSLRRAIKLHPSRASIEGIAEWVLKGCNSNAPKSIYPAIV